MHACPECRRDFRSESSYALYLARKETRAALEAEVAGEPYDVPLRFQSAPLSVDGIVRDHAPPFVTYSGDEPTKRERHLLHSADALAGRL